MVSLRRSLLIVALVAVLSAGIGIGKAITAEGSTAGGLAAPIQPQMAPAAAVPGGPGFFSQSALSCQPYSDGYQWAVDGQSVFNTGISGDYFKCPVSLPHGATVNKVVLYYYDASLSDDIQGWLYRFPLANRFADTTMAFVSSSGAQLTDQNIAATSITNPTVDLQSYAYVIQVYIPAASTNVRFYSYRIDYSYPTYLPAVLNNSN